MILEGENVIIKNRELMGATDPKNASKGTIRNLYGISIDKNSVHGSDSIQNQVQKMEQKDNQISQKTQQFDSDYERMMEQRGEMMPNKRPVM